MEKQSRAAYYRKRRRFQQIRIFTAEVSSYRMRQLERILEQQGKTKVEWLDDKIEQDAQRISERAASEATERREGSAEG